MSKTSIFFERRFATRNLLAAALIATKFREKSRRIALENVSGSSGYFEPLSRSKCFQPAIFSGVAVRSWYWADRMLKRRKLPRGSLTP